MLYDKLKEYADSGVYPMHMPGHKRNEKFLLPCSPYKIDITEIHGFDDLHDPHEVLLITARLAADLYNSREAFLLINGSTVGILAAIGASTERGDKILAVSNCHWSTPNAAELFGLEIVYITPEIDEASGVPCSISPAIVESALAKNPDIKLVVITSPTYEGVVSDIALIAEAAHNSGALLLVDSAHGAHLGFSDAFPKSATTQGADIVVISLHKTLPAMTQCSLLHVCSRRVDTAGIQKLLSILQTSSPSYVLMASMDYCLRLLDSFSTELFSTYKINLDCFSDSVVNLKKLSVLCHGRDPLHPEFYDFDPGKIVIITKNTGLSSPMLADILREDYKIEIERVYEDYVIAMTSICDSEEGLMQLADALIAIDTDLL